MLLRRKSWAQLTPLADPPALITWNSYGILTKKSPPKRKSKTTGGVTGDKSDSPKKSKSLPADNPEATNNTKTIPSPKNTVKTPVQTLVYAADNNMPSTSLALVNRDSRPKSHVNCTPEMSFGSDTDEEENSQKSLEIISPSDTDEVEDQHRFVKSPIRRVVMDSQPVLGGPNLNENLNKKRNKKSKDNRVVPQAGGWIDPNASIGGIFPVTPPTRTEN
jgi:hypothetical protein